MSVTDILQLRILPPLVIGRLGSSSAPMDNYTAEIENPVGYRVLKPAPTLMVDKESGEITSTLPERVCFRDQEGKIRPVAPFLEVWAQFEADGDLFPLTKDHLQELGLGFEDVQWRVQVANLKVFRRTGCENDRVEADTGWFNSHGSIELQGKCANFLEGATLPFGSVQYICANAKFPEIRLRFTPAAGYVYGAATQGQISSGGAKDANVKNFVYDAGKGGWLGFSENTTSLQCTNPNVTYAIQPGDSAFKSLGYLDDECDGIVTVKLTLKAGKNGEPKVLRAFARIVAGPPDFAPDSFPVRTVGDELEQALCGPVVLAPARLTDEERQEMKAEAAQIARRAMETIRLVNTNVMNQGVAKAGYGLARMDNLVFGRALEPIMDPALTDTLALKARHERILLSMQSSDFTNFGRMLRGYNEVGDLSSNGRRKMPAMLRGADGRHLALTRRQVGKVFAVGNAAAAGPTLSQMHDAPVDVKQLQPVQRDSTGKAEGEGQ